MLVAILPYTIISRYFSRIEMLWKRKIIFIFYSDSLFSEILNYHTNVYFMQ